MKKQGFIAALLCLCLTLLTGCNQDLFDPELAITAPAAAGQYEGVQEALADTVGDEIILQYPSVRGVNSAFCMVDIDGDGVNEVLAFYKPTIEGAFAHAHLFRKVKQEWRSVQDIESTAVDIAHVEFADLSGDGANEICIGWRIATTQTNLMSVYQYQPKDGKLVQCVSEMYTQYVLCDIDNNKVTDLGLAVLDTANQTSSMSFYTIEKSATRVMDTILLDSRVVSYGNITAAGVSNGVTGVYLDAFKGVDTMITELVYYQDGTLYNPFAGADDAVNVSTMRYCNVSTQDVDADGRLEIPMMEILPGYTPAKEQAITRYVLRWCSYNGAIEQPASIWWYNGADGYYLTLDPAWNGKFTVLYDSTQEAYAFYEWKQDVVGERLFNIKTFQSDDSQEGYQLLGQTETTAWGVSITPNNGLSITYDTLKTSFKMIEG